MPVKSAEDVRGGFSMACRVSCGLRDLRVAKTLAKNLNGLFVVGG